MDAKWRRDGTEKDLVEKGGHVGKDSLAGY